MKARNFLVAQALACVLLLKDHRLKPVPLALLLLLCAHPALALTTVYVSSSLGSDSNAGTLAAPWQTINKVRAAESGFTAGETVCMRGGDTWQSTGTSGTASAQLDLAGVTGSSGSPIVFTSCSGFGTGRWIIDANNTTQYCVDAIGTTVSYVTIDQLECKGAINSGILFSFSNETSSTPGMPGITISNNYVHNTGDGCSGTTGACKAGVDGPNYDVDPQIGFYNHSSCSPACAGDAVQILNNVIHDVGGHNTIRVHGDYGAFQVSGNIVGPGCLHNCIDVKMAGSSGHTALIHNNVIDVGSSLGYSDTTALYTENDDNPNSYIEYYENVAYDNSLMIQVCNSNANLLSGSGLTCASTCNIHVYAYNSTDYAYYNGAGQYSVYGPWCASGENGTGYMDVRNNIFDGSGFDYTSSFAPSNSTLLAEDYNDCGGVQTAPTWFTPQCSGAHEKLNVNPQYVSVSTADFDLRPASALINAGLSGLVTGNTNIGAYAGGGVSTATPGVAVEGWFE